MPNIYTDAGSQSVRITPGQSATYCAVAQKTGLVTGIAANSSVMSLRSTATAPVAISKVSVGFVTTTAFGTPQVVDFGLYMARSFSVADSGGLNLTLNTNDQKLNTSASALSSIVIRMSNTAALTTGTRTIDANPLAMVAGWSGAAGTTIPMTVIYDSASVKLPIIINSSEGIVLRNNEAFGASGVGYLYFALEFEQ